MACPGSIRMCEGIPERSSAYADEGTQAHELLELRLTYHREKSSPAAEALVAAAQAASQDMTEAVNVAFDYVVDIMDAFPDAILEVEHKIEIPTKATSEKIFGTCDVSIYIPSMRLLYVPDYKHGAGEYVDVCDNPQPLCYAVGEIYGHPEWDVETVVPVTIQPRYTSARAVRELWLHRSDLETFARTIDARIAAALQPDAQLVPGKKQCRWCLAGPTCPARERLMLETAGPTFADVREITLAELQPVANFTPEEIAYKLDAMELLDDYFRDVRAEAFRLARSGVHIPGRKIVEAAPRREWAGGAEDTAEKLDEITRCGTGTVEWAPRKLLVITEAEKKVKLLAKERLPKAQQKKAVEEAMDAFAFLTTKKSSGTLSLVPESDRRPAANLAELSFAEINQIPHISDGDQEP